MWWSTIAFLSAAFLPWAAVAQQRNLGPLCERSYRADFNCEGGRHGAYDKAVAEKNEMRFCDNVRHDSSVLIEQSLAKGTSVASYWSTSRGRQELEDVMSFCARSGIENMRQHFCRSYRPRCTKVLAELDRKKASCSGAKDCLERARREEQEALEELARKRKENEDAIAAAASAFSAMMDRAAQYHEAKERVLAEYPEMKKELAQDRSVLEAAIRSVGKQGAFEAVGDAASQALDPGLRGLLKLAAAASAVQEGSELNRDELREAEGGLQKAYERILRREAAMASLPASTITGLPREAQEAGAAALTPSGSPVGLLSTVMQIPTGEPAHAAAASETKASQVTAAQPGPGKGPTGRQGPSLREILAKKLREGRETTEAQDKSVASLVNPAELIAVAENQAQLPGIPAGDGRRELASLTPAELEDPGALEAIRAGILPASSETLFERAHRAHRAAEEAGNLTAER